LSTPKPWILHSLAAEHPTRPPVRCPWISWPAEILPFDLTSSLFVTYSSFPGLCPTFRMDTILSSRSMLSSFFFSRCPGKWPGSSRCLLVDRLARPVGHPGREAWDLPHPPLPLAYLPFWLVPAWSRVVTPFLLGAFPLHCLSRTARGETRPELLLVLAGAQICVSLGPLLLYAEFESHSDGAV